MARFSDFCMEEKKKAYILTTQLYLETDVLPPLNLTNEDGNMEQIGQKNFCLDFEFGIMEKVQKRLVLPHKGRGEG